MNARYNFWLGLVERLVAVVVLAVYMTFAYKNGFEPQTDGPGLLALIGILFGSFGVRSYLNRDKKE